MEIYELSDFINDLFSVVQPLLGSLPSYVKGNSCGDLNHSAQHASQGLDVLPNDRKQRRTDHCATLFCLFSLCTSLLLSPFSSPFDQGCRLYISVPYTPLYKQSWT